MTRDQFTQACGSPAVTGAVLYATDGSELPREPWPAPMVYAMDRMTPTKLATHPLAGIFDIELEEAFEKWTDFDSGPLDYRARYKAFLQAVLS